MKIGISTFTHGDNYGQRLQNLAVQETLKLSGADVLTFRQKDSRSAKYKLKSLASLIPKGLAVAHIQRHRSFEDFNSRNISFSREVISDSNPPRDIKSYTLIHKDPKTGKCITVKLAANDLIDIDATLGRLKSKGLSPEILDAIRKNLTRMATEESARSESAVELNDATSESPDA